MTHKSSSRHKWAKGGLFILISFQKFLTTEFLLMFAKFLYVIAIRNRKESGSRLNLVLNYLEYR